jgi:dihydropteroate synthase
VDTYKAGVARRAVALGATIVNDVWGLQRDPAMADVAAETGASVIIMHNRESADAELDIIDDIRAFFDRSLTLAARAGIADDAIMLDPGIGFGKTGPQNLISAATTARIALSRAAASRRLVAQIAAGPDFGQAARATAGGHHRRQHDRHDGRPPTSFAFMTLLPIWMQRG